MARKQTQEEVIEDFKMVHGDRYDYSLVEYVNSKIKVKIICKKHNHIFEQIPNDHKRGIGCPKCSGLYRYNTEEIIQEFQQIHGNKYDYSLVNYVTAKTKVKIRCKKHNHIFEQKPNDHKSGYGCPKCGGSYKYNTEEVIEDFKKLHGDRYDYSLVNYVNNSTKVQIKCNQHGIFEQSPNAHKKGDGCSKCSGLYRRNTEEVIKDFKKIHGDRYDYSLVNYVNNSTKVQIKCNQHGVFKQSPNSHKRGRGCPKCSITGFNKSKSGILYYLSINNGQAYKIGITNLSVENRYSNNDLEKITIIKEWSYQNGEECYNEEQRIIKEYSFAKYNGDNLLNGAATKEMFRYDVLGLDI